MYKNVCGRCPKHCESCTVDESFDGWIDTQTPSERVSCTSCFGGYALKETMCVPENCSHISYY